MSPLPRCQICKTNHAEYAWQPELGTRANFYLLGSHIRGFMVVKVCDHCCQEIKSGKEISFRYKGIDWWVRGDRLVNMGMCPYH